MDAVEEKPNICKDGSCVSSHTNTRKQIASGSYRMSHTDGNKYECKKYGKRFNENSSLKG